MSATLTGRLHPVSSVSATLSTECYRRSTPSQRERGFAFLGSRFDLVSRKQGMVRVAYFGRRNEERRPS